MKKSTSRLMVCAAAGISSLLVQQTMMAATYTWSNLTTGGNLAWNAPANWGGAGFPSANADVANINGDFTLATVVTTSTTVPVPKLGVLNWGDSTAPLVSVNIGSTNGGPAVTFNNGGAGAQINIGSGTALATNTFRSNMVLEDNLTINAPVQTTTSAASFNGAISESGGSWGILKTGPGFVTFNLVATPSYTGVTELRAGRIQLSGSAAYVIPGDIRINTTAITGVSQRLQNAGNERIIDTANVEFMTAISEWSMGGGNSETIGSLTSNSGMGFVQGGGTLTLSAASGSHSFGGQIGLVDAGQDIITLVKTGGSTQTLAGPAANYIRTSVSVTGGTLQLGKTAGVNALSGAITLGNGAGAGTIRLLAADQIADVSALSFNAGTLDTNGYSETLAMLTNSGASTIDLGAGASILAFANSSGQSWSGTIQILNWSGLTAGGGTDQLLFGAGGLNAGQVGMISFVNPTNYAPGTYPATLLPSGEVVAVVPEPAVLGTIAASSLLFLRRRRVRA